MNKNNLFEIYSVKKKRKKNQQKQNKNKNLIPDAITRNT